MLLVQRRLTWDLMAHLATGKQYSGMNVCSSPMAVLEFFYNEIQNCKPNSDLESELHARIGVRRLGGLKQALRACGYILEDTNDLKPMYKNLQLPTLSSTLSYSWSIPFPAELTTQQPFLRPKPLTCSMMHTRGTFLFHEKPGEYKVCGLPTSQSVVDILFVLPEHESGKQVIDIVEHLAAGEYIEMSESLRRCEGDVYLPRFESTTPSLKLMPLLEACGCPSISGNLKEDDLSFSTELRIDENGLNSDTPNESFSEETLPATVIGGKRFSLRLNKPFILIVRHKATGVVVQSAIIDNPTPMKEGAKNSNTPTAEAASTADAIFSDPIQPATRSGSLTKGESVGNLAAKKASVHSVFDVESKPKDMLAGFLETSGNVSSDPVVARRRGKKSSKEGSPMSSFNFIDQPIRSEVSSSCSDDEDDVNSEKEQPSPALNSSSKSQDADATNNSSRQRVSSFNLEADVNTEPSSRKSEPRQRISNVFNVVEDVKEADPPPEPVIRRRQHRISSAFDLDPKTGSESVDTSVKGVVGKQSALDLKSVTATESSPPVAGSGRRVSSSEPRQRISSAFDLVDGTPPPPPPPQTSVETVPVQRTSSAFNLPDAVPTPAKSPADVILKSNSKDEPSDFQFTGFTPTSSAPIVSPSPKVADLDAIFSSPEVVKPKQTEEASVEEERPKECEKEKSSILSLFDDSPASLECNLTKQRELQRQLEILQQQAVFMQAASAVQQKSASQEGEAFSQLWDTATCK
eukprot:TRINITY_DN8758_c0_g1_i1.p1 TRINITY_DN8758_c0_g1~~TRINITY_DN8758_c0_g1_i1.p1  ORF type:complete len:852 (+),score=188.97 TRINITY_DN8758_c0_g1_i1:314-2557(+)